MSKFEAFLIEVKESAVQKISINIAMGDRAASIRGESEVPWRAVSRARGKRRDLRLPDVQALYN
jgi:hypothetical protein